MGRRVNQVDHDQLFKNLIKAFFREFVEFFLPDEAQMIDFDKVRFLDKEFFTDTTKGKRRAMDLVVEVGLRGGGSEFILVHTEFESSKKLDFPKRMFKYFSQLYLRYEKPIIPMAIFTDKAKWTKPLPDEFKVEFLGKVYNHFCYKSIKLMHLSVRDYLRIENPIVFALMAKMQYDRRQMVRFKAEFLRRIAGADVNDARREVLFEFVESYMPLSRDRQEEFYELIELDGEYEGVEKMVTTYEKRGLRIGRKEGRKKGLEEGLEKGLEEGLEKGLEEGRKLAAINLLADGFSIRDVARLTGLTLAEVKALR